MSCNAAMCTGARDDVRTCYLKSSFQRDPDLAAFAYSYAPPYLHRSYPQVSIDASSPLSASWRVMVEFVQ